MSADPVLRRPGRPRSERAERAIIEATLDLLAEEPGVAGVSIEAVAARAAVGKTTIYRRWPNKEALIVDALATLKSPLPELPGRSVREDLIIFGKAAAEHREDRYSRCLWNVMGGAEKHPEILKQFEIQVLAPRKEIFLKILARGVASGEIRPDIDADSTRLLFIGALTFPGRSPGAKSRHGGDWVEKMVDTLLSGLAPR
ncbi:TetR/AcrR family transcriptional regulator [Actinocorallia lasiicapitis]